MNVIESATPPIVSVEGLVQIYRLEGQDIAALSGVNLSVQPGEIVALVGPVNVADKRRPSVSAKWRHGTSSMRIGGSSAARFDRLIRR